MRNARQDARSMNQDTCGGEDVEARSCRSVEGDGLTVERESEELIVRRWLSVRRISHWRFISWIWIISDALELRRKRLEKIVRITAVANMINAKPSKWILLFCVLTILAITFTPLF